MKPEDAARLLTQGVLAEYSALRAELLQRTSRQGGAVQASLGLTGGLLALLLSKNLLGIDYKVFLAALKGSQTNNLDLLFLLFTGYVFALGLLAMISLYELHMIFRISNYLAKLDKRLRQIVPSDIPFLGWDAESRGLADARRTDGKPHRMGVRFALSFGANLQSAPLFAQAAFGFYVLVRLFCSIAVENPLPNVETISVFSVFLAMLIVMWLSLTAVFLGLHKWLQGGRGLPHSLLKYSANLGERNTPENEVTRAAKTGNPISAEIPKLDVGL